MIRFVAAGFLVAGAVAASQLSANAAIPRSPSIVADVAREPLQDLGEAPASQPIRLSVTLHYRNEAQLDKLIEAQSDPYSPLYRHFLSNAQFNDYFAPSPADYSGVARILNAAGFHVVQSFGNRTVIDLTGSVGAADRVFGTSIHRVLQPGYGLRYTNVRAAVLSGELGAAVRDVAGLSDLHTLHTDIATVRRGGVPKPGAALSAFYGPVSSTTGIAGYSPLAFEDAYDLPKLHGDDGKGRAIGIVIDADFADADLAAFLAYFGITRTGSPVEHVRVDGGPVPRMSVDSSETTLDVETIASNAPAAGIHVYEFPTLDGPSSIGYVLDAYNRVVDDNVVDIASSSFGGCDFGVGLAAAKAWDAIAAQGAAKGITFLASSGDLGVNEGCTEAPASATHFVAVGGTELGIDSHGKWREELAWTGSGGGVSSIFALPSWQRNIPNVIRGGRNVPDIGLDADPYTGTALYYSGPAQTGCGSGWDTCYNPVGGTSLASPLLGAAMAGVDQMLGGRSGLIAPKLYALLRANAQSKHGGVVVHDITIGGNGEFFALPGYDQVTGIGSIDVNNAFGKGAVTK